MRRLALALLLLAAPAWAQTAPPRAAPPAGREAASAPPRLPAAGTLTRQHRAGARSPATRGSAGAHAAARAYLCPAGGTPVFPGRCRPPRPGALAALRPGAPAGSEVAGWHLDLPPPSRAQRPCPPGTRAFAAREQPDVVRCVPE